MLKKPTGKAAQVRPFGLAPAGDRGGAAAPGAVWRAIVPAPKTEMTYTEFKTALRAGQIQTATVGIDQISGKLRRQA